jgi:hypothetical protein
LSAEELLDSRGKSWPWFFGNMSSDMAGLVDEASPSELLLLLPNSPGGLPTVAADTTADAGDPIGERIEAPTLGVRLPCCISLMDLCSLGHTAPAFGDGHGSCAAVPNWDVREVRGEGGGDCGFRGVEGF